jgi:hypothetical protein
MTYALVPAIVQWLVQNNMAPALVYVDSDDRLYADFFLEFQTASHAVMFKLAWGGDANTT